MKSSRLRTRNKERFEKLLVIANYLRMAQQNPHAEALPVEQARYMILEHAVSELDAKSGSIMLYDDSSKSLRVETGLDLNQPNASDMEIKVGSDHISAVVFRSGNPLYLRDISSENVTYNFYEKQPSGSCISLPLVTVDGVAGVINFNSKLGQRFERDDYGYSMILGTYASAMIDKYNAMDRPDIQEREEMIYELAKHGFLRAVYEKNDWVGRHCAQVTNLSNVIMQAMNAKTHQLEEKAILHDVGKVGVSDYVLEKPEQLTPEEWIEMEAHTLIGEAILSIIDPNGMSKCTRYHHQRYDGRHDVVPRSYPDDISGDQIPIEAAIIAVADTIEAMTAADRPYRNKKPAVPLEVAISEVRRESGRQFNPGVVEGVQKAYRDGAFDNFFPPEQILYH